jgi:iron complex outermembrane receptor protein
MRTTLLAVLGAALLAAPVFPQEGPVITGKVTTRDDNLPLPGATVAVEALKISATTDVEGKYTLSLPADQAGKSVEVKVSAGGLRPRVTTLTVKAGRQEFDFALGLGFAEEVTVGSRAMGAEAEKAVPVDILTSREIATTGASETNQILEALAPSFNFPRPTLSDGADTVRPATLRGLGPDQVLVLINGKRRHQSAHIPTSGVIGRGSTGVDLNAIPASMIERIEVLRDGAAAQYGSDAIAGVINVVLKSGVSPATVSLKGGTTKTSFTNMQVQDVRLSDGELFDSSATYGFNVGKGTLTLTAEYRDRNPTNRASPDVRDQVRTGDALNNGVAQPNHHWGDSDEQNVMTFANLNYPLGAAKTFLYGFGGWSKRNGSHGGFYRRALDARNWPSIYPLGFLPTIEPEVVDGSGTLGVRGVRGAWVWDVSGQLGHNRFDFNVVDSLNTSLGPNVPPNQTSFYAGSLVFDQLLGNVDVSREVKLGALEKPVNVAFGAELRRETYRIEAGEPASYVDGGVRDQFGGRAPAGAQVFPGFRPSNEVDKSRTSVAGYVDVEGDVSEKFRLGLAGRVEHYSDFGGTADGKVTARFAATPRFVVRGAVSTGFRAPSLAQANFSTVSTNFINVGGVVTPVEVGTFAVDSPVARALGASDLKPEQSFHLSGGVVASPVEGLDLTLDVYRVTIDDRIVFSGNFTGGPINPILAPFSASGARFFTNAIDTETVGFDLTANVRLKVPETWGSLRLGASYNRNDTDVVGTVNTPDVLRTLLADPGAVLFDREQTFRTTCGQPKDNVRFTGDWQKSRLSALARVSRYGSYCFATNVPAADQTFTPKWVADLDLTYTVQKVTIGAGVQNLFDTYPDRVSTVNSAFLVQTFPATSPFGMNGRFLYGRVSYRF